MDIKKLKITVVPAKELKPHEDNVNTALTTEARYDATLRELGEVASKLPEPPDLSLEADRKRQKRNRQKKKKN